MSGPISTAELLVKYEKLAEAHKRLRKDIEQFAAVFVFYNDAQSHNPTYPILLPAIVTWLNKNTNEARLLILDAARSGGVWQKEDTKMGLDRGQWRPMLIPLAVRDQFAELLEKTDEGAESAGNGNRKPAAASRS